MQDKKEILENRIKWQHLMLLLWLLVASMMNTYYKNKYEQTQPAKNDTLSLGS